MGKIDEFEQKLIQQGMTDEDLVEYGKLLKRVRGNFAKRQHCYTTAIQFPNQQGEQAVKLIRYGLESFEDGWFSTYTSYLYIGHIYERLGDYQKAYDAYLQAKEALDADHEEYEKELSRELMWMKLHIDGFRYSAELEEYLSGYEQTGEFSKALVNAAFKGTVAKLVIAIHYGKTDEARQHLETARRICEPGYEGQLHSLLASNGHWERLDATPEAKAFLAQIKI